MKLSGYILTYNSDKFLDIILSKMNKVCDEIFVIDSGSTDNTQLIASSFNANFIFNKFINYTKQRNFAHSICNYDYILWFDSDEIPSDELIEFIINEKKYGFKFLIYSFLRENYVLNKKVNVFYPVNAPEYRERLCIRQITYIEDLYVHETLDKHYQRQNYDFIFEHHTCSTYQELNNKLYKYSKLHSLQRNFKFSYLKLLLSPFGAFIKWYILKKGFKDGKVGFILGLYAFKYTFLKYFFKLKYNN